MAVGEQSFVLSEEGLEWKFSPRDALEMLIYASTEVMMMVLGLLFTLLLITEMLTFLAAQFFQCCCCSSFYRLELPSPTSGSEFDWLFQTVFFWGGSGLASHVESPTCDSSYTF